MLKKRGLNQWVSRLLSGILLGTSFLAAAEPVFPPHQAVEPSAAIQAYAQAQDIPLEGQAAAADVTSTLQCGDRCVTLVTLQDGRKQTQWLVDFSVDELNDDEQEKLPETDAANTTLHTSTGRELKFGFKPVAMNVSVIGPLATDEKRIERAVQRVEVKEARFIVNGEFLGLGLDRAASTIMRLRDNSGKVGFSVTTGDPFPPEEIASNRQRFETRGVTAEDERAMAGAVPALFEFFGIALKTPGLREILFKAIDVPWWALVKSLGNVSSNINVHGPGIRTAGPSENAYVVPLKVSISNKLALMAELVVQRPQAPGSALAGITAIHAGQPDGDGPKVSIALLATRRSETTP